MQLVDRIVAPLRRPTGGATYGLAGAAPALVSFALVLVIAAQLASLLWRVLGAAEDGAGIAEPAVEVPSPGVDVAAIVNAHLFGVAPQSGDPSDAPATTANLMLAGTLAGREPERGWAIIGASGQSARVYATGASLPGGARLHAVYPDRVILDRSGARESLLLPRLSSGAGAGRALPRSAGMPPGAAPNASIADSVRQLLVQNPSAGSELLRPQPVFAGGSLRGYRVYPGRNRAQFAGLGLQPGDLVLAVNGAALDDPNRGLEILRGVGQGSAVTLTIERGGQQQQITVDPVAVVQELQAPVEPAQDEEPEVDDMSVVEDEEAAE
ncbi:MAG: type II secretion system protein GspC [Gammaproteobacteria bacterium]|nr:type II secretion system protein GspC [Gammaproteobacteria bacterium]